MLTDNCEDNREGLPTPTTLRIFLPDFEHMRRRSREGIASSAVLLVISAALMAGCGNEGQQLDLGQGEFNLCVPAPADPGVHVIFGDVFLQHSGSELIKITNVELVESQNLELIEAALVELAAEDALVGLRYTTTLDDAPEGWKDRTAAIGSTLEPGDSRNLVFVVAKTGGELGSANAVRVHYDSRDDAAWQETNTRMLVSDGPCEDALADS